MTSKGRFLAALTLFLLACGGDGGTGPADDGPDDGGNEPTPGDTIAPSVVSVSPADGATGVSVNAVLRVTFSEPVILQSGPSGMDLETSGRQTATDAEWASATSIEFSPRYPLDLGASYEATFAGMVTDTAGNPPAEGRMWSFATEGSPLPGVEALNMIRDISVLADDSMRGRFTGSVEGLEAAQYVRSRFQALGLDPGAADYFQPFEVDAASVEPGTVSRNVIGVLPGHGGLADQWIVVGGHYDHLGVRNDNVMNGADDNASGTAMMMELARALSRQVDDGGFAEEDRRSVIFMAFGSEELGLLGSEHFCEDPTVPMDRIVGMMNLDMVGRLRDEQLWVIGTNPGALRGLFPAVNRTGLSLLDDPTLIGRSDQYCFFARNKPVAFLHTGVHPQYHTQFDDLPLINGAGMQEVGALALRALTKMILAPEPIR